ETRRKASARLLPGDSIGIWPVAGGVRARAGLRRPRQDTNRAFPSTGKNGALHRKGRTEVVKPQRGFCAAINSRQTLSEALLDSVCIARGPLRAGSALGPRD